MKAIPLIGTCLVFAVMNLVLARTEPDHALAVVQFVVGLVCAMAAGAVWTMAALKVRRP